MISRPKLYRNA